MGKNDTPWREKASKAKIREVLDAYFDLENTYGEESLIADILGVDLEASQDGLTDDFSKALCECVYEFQTGDMSVMQMVAKLDNLLEGA